MARLCSANAEACAFYEDGFCTLTEEDLPFAQYSVIFIPDDVSCWITEVADA